jgi:hypothetical protein
VPDPGGLKIYGSGLETTRFKSLVTGIFELDVAANSLLILFRGFPDMERLGGL